MSVVRKQLERLGPYQALFLLAVPTLCVEPLKFLAVAVAGKGHWLTGAAMITAAYAFSLHVLERLFVIVKPKLLKLLWFAIIWGWFVRIRSALLAPFRYLAAKFAN
jgi:hypothetical protein